MKVLVLCHGNINRSALAEAVLKKHGPATVTFTSAGFVNPGRRAAKKMRVAAANWGYSLEDHRSQLVDRDMVLGASLVIYMDGGNYKRLKEMFNGELVQIRAGCLGQWSTPVQRHRIPDPAFMAKGSKEFDDTVDLIIDAAYNLSQDLIA